MTCHRARTVLAIAWVLLLPPPGENGSQAPIGLWQHAGSFGSAQECEAARAELIAAARRPLGDPWMIPDMGDTGRVTQKNWWADSRCRRRDDPRIEPLDGPPRR